LGREVTIAIRGTDNKAAFQSNWIANLGIANGETAALRQYLQNLGEFTASVISANPGANIRFVGHSLGGALGMVVAAFTGADAFAFNAPPIGNVLPLLYAGSFDREFTALRELNRERLSQDTHNLVNIRVSLDGVSALPFPQRGQWITMAPDTLEYLVRNPAECIVSSKCSTLRSIARLFPPLEAADDLFGRYHSIDSLLAQLVSPDLQILDVSYDGASFATKPRELRVHEALERILLPDTAASFVKVFTMRDVSALLEYYIDPQVARGWDFSATSDSPLFRSVRVPELGVPGLEYAVQVYVNGAWVTTDSLLSLEEFVFDDAGVSRFRLLTNAALPGSMQSNDIFFGVTFAANGIFSGSVAAIPEPSSYVFFGVGVLVLSLRLRARYSPAVS
jgi:hypothetical protein